MYKPIAELIAELRELHAKATPGPWANLGPTCSPDDFVTYHIGEFLEDDPPFASVWQELQGGDLEATTRLIVALRNAIPRLLDELEAAQAKFDGCMEGLRQAEAELADLRAENEKLRAVRDAAVAVADSLIVRDDALDAALEAAKDVK